MAIQSMQPKRNSFHTGKQSVLDALTRFQPTIILNRSTTMSLGPTELIIILVIVILLFGIGRVGRIGGELGSAVANFRKGLNTNKEETTTTTTTIPADQL